MRMMGYFLHPFCGKSCCRIPGKPKDRITGKQTVRAREKRAWKKDQQD